MEWKAFELHCHTRHSDGKFTVDALCRAAGDEAYDGLALTDHNTLAGLRGFDEAAADCGLIGVRGIEWTTFFGHMLVIGARRYVDWRFVAPDGIDRAMEEVRRAGGTVGIAHPKALGNPVSTGSHWNFRVTRWELVNYIEVWSRAFPQRNPQNGEAFRMWDELLGRGYRIAASAGRDWHLPAAEPVNAAATYLGLEGPPSHESAVDALKKGRMFVTVGPRLLFSVRLDSRTALPGDEGPAGPACLTAAVSPDRRREVYDRFRIHPRYVSFVHNGITLTELPAESAGAVCHEASLSPGWLRAELYGEVMGEPQLIAFTSPVYLT